MAGFYLKISMLVPFIIVGCDSENRNWDNPADPASDNSPLSSANTSQTAATDDTDAAATDAGGSSGSAATEDIGSSGSTSSTTSGKVSSGGTTNAASSTKTATNTSTSTTTVVDTPILTFSSAVSSFCSDQPLQLFVPNVSNTDDPWVITKSGHNLVAQRLDRTSDQLADVGSAITINSGGNACLNAQYTPTLKFGASNASGSLYTMWNCTGDGVDRFWLKGIGADGSTAMENNYIGDTLGYDVCTFSTGASVFKCGAKIYTSAFSFDSTSLQQDAGTGLNAQIGVTAGFASVSGAQLQVYNHTTKNICTLTLSGTGMGLVESSDGAYIYAYNGKIVDKITVASCAKTTIGAVRTGSDAYYLAAPKLVLKSSSLVAGGKLNNSLQLEEVTLGATPTVGHILSVATSGQTSDLHLIRNASGSRFVAQVVNSQSSCTDLKVSEVIPW